MSCRFGSYAVLTTARDACTHDMNDSATLSSMRIKEYVSSS